MKLNVSQINQDQLSLAIQQYSSGAAFSGNFVWYVENSGFLGPLAVTTTGSQVITGSKRFLDPILIPYSGGSGAAPSARWVTDQIELYSGYAIDNFVTDASLSGASGQLSSDLFVTGSGLYTLLTNQSGQAATDYATKTQLTNTGAALSRVQVTGGGLIQSVNLSGYGGTQVVHSGNFVLISGSAGGGGGGSNVLVTGSSTISSANFSGAGSVVLTYDGTYVRVSGTAGADATLSGYVENNFVNRTTAQSVTGIKTFVSSPIVPTATSETQAINLGQLSGTSGVLVSLNLSTSGILYAQMTGASGVLATAGGGTTNNYSITGTGSIFITNNSTGAAISNIINVVSGNITTATNVLTGSVTNSYSISGNPIINTQTSGSVTYNVNGTAIVSGGTLLQSGTFATGNYVNMSFYFDQYSLYTGLNIIESFVSRDFSFTGYALGVINSGTQGFFSGSFYQRDQSNAKTNFLDISLNSGLLFKSSGGFSQPISGLNRVGLDIYRIGTGITGLSVGFFGAG